MDPLWSILMLFGSALCHQLPERSYILGDLQMPLCARCIGIHVGFLLSSIVVWSGSRRFASGMPNRKALIVLGAMAVIGAAEALLSYGGLSESDNARRTISGLLIGVPLPFVAVPLLNLFVFPGRNARASFNSPLDWMLLAAAFIGGLAVILFKSSSIVLFSLASVLGIIGMCTLIFTMALLLVGVLTEGKRLSLRRRAVTAAMASIIFLVVLAAIHNLLLPQI